jgi:hypothetical protein
MNVNQMQANRWRARMGDAKCERVRESGEVAKRATAGMGRGRELDPFTPLD